MKAEENLVGVSISVASSVLLGNSSESKFTVFTSLVLALHAPAFPLRHLEIQFLVIRFSKVLRIGSSNLLLLYFHVFPFLERDKLNLNLNTI